MDAFGPVFAIELFDDVGGTGATILWVIAGALNLFIVGSFLDLKRVSPERVRALGDSDRAAVTVGDLGFWMGLALTISLFGDLARSGVVPLFSGLERWEYTEQYAGPIHRWFLDFGNLISFVFGTLSVYPRLRGGRLDLRFPALLAVLFVYCVLTGHRFSVFYAFSSYFFLPYATLYMGCVEPRATQFTGGRLHRFFTSSAARFVSAFIGIVALGGAIANSLVNVRGFAPAMALFSFAQRALVQPQELWFVTYEHVFLNGNYDPSRAFEFLFFDPIVPDRNSTIQYLMARSIGEAQAAAILAQGSQYAGGYPEIMFELGGPIWGWSGVILVAVTTGVLLRQVLLAIYEGRLLSAFSVMYVLYAIFVIYIGGMLNFLVNPLFWIKVAVMGALLLLERNRDGSPNPIVRWVVWRAPRIGTPSVGRR